MAVDVQVDGDTFKPGLPRPLFKTGLTPLRPDEQPDYLYDVTPDGERFLLNPSHEQPAVAEAADAPPTTLNVIVNWSVGLGQK